MIQFTSCRISPLPFSLNSLAFWPLQEKEVNRLKERLYEAQQQLELWRSKALSSTPTPPPQNEDDSVGVLPDIPRHVKSAQGQHRSSQKSGVPFVQALSSNLATAMEN
jgi:hypothetical protein